MTGEDGRSGAGGGEPEASPPPGSKSGGRRARMWRVTLNCSGSQTPRLPARPPAARFPAKARAHPKQRSASPVLAAGRRVRPPSPARHTAWVRATGDTAPLPFPGEPQRDGRCSPTRPGCPAPSSPPLLAPPFPAPVPPLLGRCTEWSPRRLELVPVRSQLGGPRPRLRTLRCSRRPRRRRGASTLSPTT